MLVEGLEDRAYITAALALEGAWDDIRRAGMHLISCDRKSSILQLLAIAKELDIPCFVVFDADGHEDNDQRRKEHERDNTELLKCLGLKHASFPDKAIWEATCAVWPQTLEEEIKASFKKEDWESFLNEAKKAIDPGARLKKNPAFIGEIVSVLWSAKKKPAALMDLIASLTKFTKS